MDSKGGPAVLSEILCQVIGDPFRASENQNFGVLLTYLVKVLDQFATFLEVGANFDDLLNVMVGCEVHGPNVDLNEVFQEILKIPSATR
jgi:hypothetical protein